jgi:hypothetical protein
MQRICDINGNNRMKSDNLNIFKIDINLYTLVYTSFIFQNLGGFL